MSRSRKTASLAHRRGQPQRSCALWFLFGALVGGFGVGIAWMNAESTDLQQTQAPPPPSTKTTTQKPEFDFYSLLPEEEVVVPVEEEPPTVPSLPVQPAPPKQEMTRPAQTEQEEQVHIKPATPVSEPKTSQPPTRPGDYLLQLASFRSSADAETLKAELALQGIQTFIQRVTIGSGETYYRVRTGSLGRAEAQAMKDRLAARGQDALLVRVR